MENFTSKKKLYCEIAGLTYCIEYAFDSFIKRFDGYLLDSSEVEEKELANEEVINVSYTAEEYEQTKEDMSEEFSDAYAEYLTIMTKIVKDLPNHDMLLMHGAVVEYNDKAYVFTAPSGTGKTTHIKMWKKYLGNAVTIINGDKPEVSFEGDRVYVHGAPWCGKEGWNTNKKSLLNGVCLVKRGTENKITKMDPKEIIDLFLGQFFIFDEGMILKVLDMFIKITENVPFYMLECDMSEEAAKCSFEEMTKLNWEECKY